MIRRPSFLSIFVKSPFKRIEQHMSVVHECVALFPDFFEAAQDEKWSEAEAIAKKVKKLENEADALKRKIQVKLHGDLFLPVPRADILSLLLVQDNMANKAEDLTGLMLGRQMIFPKPVRSEVKKLIDHMVITSNKALEVSSELRGLFDAGFEGVVLKLLKEAVEGLDALESEADLMQKKIRQSIFEIEKDHPPIDVFFWYQFIHEIATLIDWARRVGTQLLILSSR